MSANAALTAPATTTRTHSRLYWLIADTWVVTRRHLLHIPQQPEQLFSATIQPIMFILLFVYCLGGAIDVPGMSYVNFLMAGIFVQSIVMEGMTGASGLAMDLKRGIIDRFRTLPMSPAAALTGPILSDVVRNLFAVVVMVTVGLLVGFRPDANPLEWLGAVGMLLLAGFTISWIGTVVALIVRDPEAVQIMAFVVLLPLSFASSAFVPVDTMPGWLQPIVRHQPVTVIVTTVRGLLINQPIGTAAWQAIGWCALITAVCLPLSIVLYRRVQQV